MIDPLFQTDNMALAQKLMDAAALRQDAIAANLANADTPGYRRVDLASDFATQLKTAYEAGDLSAQGPSGGPTPTLVQDPNAASVRPDGNDVDIDRELVAMDKNSVNYEFLADVVTHNIKQLKVAITGQP